MTTTELALVTHTSLFTDADVDKAITFLSDRTALERYVERTGSGLNRMLSNDGEYVLKSIRDERAALVSVIDHSVSEVSIESLNEKFRMVFVDEAWYFQKLSQEQKDASERSIREYAAAVWKCLVLEDEKGFVRGALTK